MPKTIYSNLYNYEPIINITLQDNTTKKKYLATCKIIAVFFEGSITSTIAPIPKLLINIKHLKEQTDVPINIRALNDKPYPFPNKLYLLFPLRTGVIYTNSVLYSGKSILQDVINNPYINTNRNSILIYEANTQFTTLGFELMIDKTLLSRNVI